MSDRLHLTPLPSAAFTVQGVYLYQIPGANFMRVSPPQFTLIRVRLFVRTYLIIIFHSFDYKLYQASANSASVFARSTRGTKISLV